MDDAFTPLEDVNTLMEDVDASAEPNAASPDVGAAREQDDVSGEDRTQVEMDVGSEASEEDLEHRRALWEALQECDLLRKKCFSLLNVPEDFMPPPPA